MIKKAIADARCEWLNTAKKKDLPIIPIITPDKPIVQTPAKPYNSNGAPVHEIPDTPIVQTPAKPCNLNDAPVYEIPDTPTGCSPSTDSNFDVYNGEIDAEHTVSGLGLSLIDCEKLRKPLVTKIIELRRENSLLSIDNFTSIVLSKINYLPLFQCHRRCDVDIYKNTTNDFLCGIRAFKQVVDVNNLEKNITEEYKTIDKHLKKMLFKN